MMADLEAPIIKAWEEEEELEKQKQETGRKRAREMALLIEEEANNNIAKCLH